MFLLGLFSFLGEQVPEGEIIPKATPRGVFQGEKKGFTLS